MPSHRNDAIDPRQHLRCVFRLLHRRHGIAGVHRIDANLGRQLNGHGAHHRQHRRLAGVVVGIMAIGHDTGRRSRHQDGATSILALHMARRQLAHIEHAMHVHPHHPVEVLAVDVDELAADRNAGIADQRVEATQRLERLRESIVNPRPIRDVHGRHMRECGKLGGDCPGVVRVAAPDGDLGPFVQKPRRHRGTYPG